jgi:outer membrane protein assembly factor BamB
MTRFIFAIAIFVGDLCNVMPHASAQVNVAQEHNNPSRDGVYIDPAFRSSAVANLTRDLNFDGTISGDVYAQPLYIEGGPSGPMIIAVTESNNVYALDATTGTVIWEVNVGPPVTSGLPCANINPVGITGTPVVDLESRRLFFDALIDGLTKKHFIYSLNVDTGTTTPGWPVDVNAAATYNGMTYESRVQEERGGLALVNGIVYVAYSGYSGDCENYHGWVVGVDINNPSGVMAWATTAVGGGIWGHGGVASDGTNIFVVTGNTFNTGGNWMGGEAIIRLQAGPVWSDQPTDYWAPGNWVNLDVGDTDLGGVSATVIDVPGATPSELVLALGKDGNAYLVDRNNLGGINGPVYQADVMGINRGTSAVTYHTRLATYIAFHNEVGTIRAYKITAASPPAIVFAWSQNQNGRGSPWVTTIDGTNNTIVWVAGTGTGGDQRLHGYDGETGAVVYAGGGNNELMTGTRQWNTGIAARGRIYFAADDRVYAFILSDRPTPTPTASPTPTSSATATATPTRPTPTPRPRVTPRARPTPAPRPEYIR